MAYQNYTNKQVSCECVPKNRNMAYGVRIREGEEDCLHGLRKVPNFVTAHTFCASRDTHVSYGWYLLIRGCFTRFQNYAEKAEICKCY